MKKALFLFLLSLLTTWVPCGFSYGAGFTNDEGVDGEYGDIGNNGSGGGVNGGCTFKDVGKTCSKTGTKKGICKIIDVDKKENIPKGQESREKQKKNGNTVYETPSCSALICSEGYLLELYDGGKNKGNSKGICRTYKKAKEDCQKRMKETCSKQHKTAEPNYVPNPNDKTDKRAYMGCFCAAENPVMYECGDGTGTPPEDTTQYTNVDTITALENDENRHCRKTGYHFKNWLCGDKSVSPGETFKIKNEITCVAKWEKNEYELKYECGTGTGSVQSQKKQYNDTVTLLGYNAGCTMAENTFKNWKCGNKTYNAGEKLQITDNITCVAQWQTCEKCKPGTGCTCQLSVENNQCIYTTGTEPGYMIKSGKNKANPQCVLASKQNCIDSGGIWDDNTKTCKCNPDVPGAHWDITNKQCKCDDPAQQISNGQCITPVNCDPCAPGEGCNCKLKIENNQCVYTTTPKNGYNLVSGNGTKEPHCALASKQECEGSGGVWEDGQCKCPHKKPGTHWDIENKICKCDDPAQQITEDGQCITPVNCAPCAPGEGCNCELKTENNQCVYTTTPKEGYNLVSGNGTKEPHCEQKTKCPNGATGTYPDCDCTDNNKYYDSTTNQCLSHCNESIATWDGSECKCIDSNKTYHANTSDISLSTCECTDPNKKEDENGQCVECPSGSIGTYPDCECTEEYKKYNKEQNKCVDDTVRIAQEKYDAAKAKEQSKENRTLTALSVAATGIGGMELAMGLSQQAADSAADMDMAAYLATMRCTYGNDVQVKAGPDEIELPGANDTELMSLRDEYFALAKDLKERKEALGMKPGIESEEIIDKAQTGLYDDESLSIDSGAYASLYRAQMLGSEVDQQKIDEERKASKNRVIAGGVLAGAGVVGGMVGNAIINKEKDSKIEEEIEEKLEEKVEEIKTGFKHNKTQSTVTPVSKPACEDIDNCLATNGYNYRALNSDQPRYRSCYVPSRPKTKDDPDPDIGLSTTARNISTCEGLEPDEWEINFSYGTVKGTSRCSSTPGTHVGKLQGYEVTPVPGNPTPGNKESEYCWCMAKDVPYSNFSTGIWIPIDSTSDGMGHLKCYERGCAHACVINIASISSFRKSLFGYYNEDEDNQ